MAVQAIPFTLFQTKGIEERNRSLRYDLNAMADFEQTTGMGLPRLMATQAIFATTRALLWAGLKHADRGLTIDVVGMKLQEYVQADGEINDILKACMEACVAQKAIPGMKMADLDDDEGAGQTPNAQSPLISLATGTTTDRGPVTSEPGK